MFGDARRMFDRSTKPRFVSPLKATIHHVFEYANFYGNSIVLNLNIPNV